METKSDLEDSKGAGASSEDNPMENNVIAKETPQSTFKESSIGDSVKSVEGPTEKSLEGSAEKSFEGSAEKSVKESAAKSAEDSAAKSAEDSAAKSAEDSAAKSGEDSAAKSGENPAEKFVEDSAEKSVEDSAEKSTEDCGEKSVEDSTQKSVEDSTQKSVEESDEKSEEDSDKKSVEESAAKSVEESVAESPSSDVSNIKKNVETVHIDKKTELKDEAILKETEKTTETVICDPNEEATSLSPGGGDGDEEDDNDEEDEDEDEDIDDEEEEEAVRNAAMRAFFLKTEDSSTSSSKEGGESDTTTNNTIPVGIKKSPLAGRGDVDQLVKYLDETDPSHKLRSLCKKGDTEGLRQFLKEKGNEVDIDSLSDEGWTCLHEVITHECQFIEVARILVEFGANVNTQDIHGDSPLHSTLLYHNVENVLMLLKNGADVNLVNVGGRYPIHVADDVETLRLLLDSGNTSVDCQDRLGNSPLHFAVVSKDKERVKLLLQYNPRVNIQNHSGSCPLHLTNGDYDIAQMLLDVKDCDPNIPDINGNTPLHLAVRGRHKDVVRLIMSKNGDPTIKNASRKTVLNLAKDKEMKRILTKSHSSSNSCKKVIASNKKPPTPTPLTVPLIDKTLLPDFPNTKGILRKRPREEDEENGPTTLRKGPRLSFNEVVDYSGVESVENEKRVKVPPIYIEPQFSSDED